MSHAGRIITLMWSIGTISQIMGPDKNLEYLVVIASCELFIITDDSTIEGFMVYPEIR